jgi:hypothetical protein
MNRLPTELLIHIFSLLAFRDKLECALTCRDWHTKISSTVLYSKINYKYTQSDMRTKLENNTVLGLQILDLRINEIDDPLELAKLCPNLKSLQLNNWFPNNWDNNNNASLAQIWRKLETINEARTNYIFDVPLRHYLTLKLLDTPLYAMSLSTVTMNLYERPDILLILIKQLRHAPVLDRLCLEEAPNINYEKLDVLHASVPNLKHLELRIIYGFVENDKLALEREALLTDLSVVPNLRSISITFSDNYITEIPTVSMEALVIYWVEYMCRRYTNLFSISMAETDWAQREYNKEIEHTLQRAFENWTQLVKFNMQPVYLNNTLFDTLDDCNTHLQDLTVYIEEEIDMEQFIRLAYSKQRNSLKKLTVYDNSWSPTQHTRLDYFFQSMESKNCQLQSFEMHSRTYTSASDPHLLSPIQILGYTPTLQRLSLTWPGTTQQTRIMPNQTTLLTHLDLRLCLLDIKSKLEFTTQQHIQDVIYASPLLRSFSIDFDSKIHDATFDLQLTKLESFKCVAQSQDVIKVIRNNETKMYTFYPSVLDPADYALKEEPRKKNSPCRMVLYLPSTVHSLIIKGNQYSL